MCANERNININIALISSPSTFQDLINLRFISISTLNLLNIRILFNENPIPFYSVEETNVLIFFFHSMRLKYFYGYILGKLFALCKKVFSI